MEREELLKLTYQILDILTDYSVDEKVDNALSELYNRVKSDLEWKGESSQK